MRCRTEQGARENAGALRMRMRMQTLMQMGRRKEEFDRTLEARVGGTRYGTGLGEEWNGSGR